MSIPSDDDTYEGFRFKAPSTRRIEKLKRGDYQFGCAGTHGGVGSEDCPRERHHHHDEFCAPPLPMELRLAGVDIEEFKKARRSRA